MLAMSIADLQARAEELARQQKELQCSLAAAKRKLSAGQPLSCTPWMRAVAVRLLALSDFNENVVREYLLRKRRHEVPADVRDWYDSLPLAEVARLLAPGGDATSARQLAEAERFWGEFRLMRWVGNQNAESGIAPTAGAVLEHAGPTLARQVWRPNRFRWLRQTMSRWGGRRVNFSGGSDQLSPVEFERKVLLAVVASFAARGGPVSGVRHRSNFGVAPPQIGRANV